MLLLSSILFIAGFATQSVAHNNQNSKYALKEVQITSLDGKPVRIFKSNDLKKYDGSNPKLPILMGVKGVVFDVTSGRRFYGKDADYNALVGKDSTRAVAIMSLESDDLTHDTSDLSENDLKSLDDIFEETYMAKYPVVGYMDYLLERYPDKFSKIKIVKSEL